MGRASYHTGPENTTLRARVTVEGRERLLFYVPSLEGGERPYLFSCWENGEQASCECAYRHDEPPPQPWQLVARAAEVAARAGVPWTPDQRVAALPQPEGWLERRRVDGTPLTDAELVALIAGEKGVSKAKARHLLAAERDLAALLDRMVDGAIIETDEEGREVRAQL